MYEREKPRVCLKCNHTFPSKGPENRICPECQTENTGCRDVTRPGAGRLPRRGSNARTI